MLKIRLLSFITTLSLTATAQKNTTIISSYISGGVGNMSGNIGRYYFENGRAPRGDISFGSNYSAALQGGYMFTKHIGIASGVTYDHSAWQYETTGSLRKSKTTSQERIQIPLLIRFENTNKRKRGGYFFHVGANISYLQSIKDNINGPISASIESEFNKTTYSLQANMGAFIPINKSIHWIVGVDGQHQLSNNYTKPEMKGYLTGLTFFTGVSSRF